jgi:hypothetical protein
LNTGLVPSIFYPRNQSYHTFYLNLAISRAPGTMGLYATYRFTRYNGFIRLSLYKGFIRHLSVHPVHFYATNRFTRYNGFIHHLSVQPVQWVHTPPIGSPGTTGISWDKEIKWRDESWQKPRSYVSSVIPRFICESFFHCHTLRLQHIRTRTLLATRTDNSYIPTCSLLQLSPNAGSS